MAGSDGKVVIEATLDTKKAQREARGLGGQLKRGLATGTKVAAAGLAAVGTAAVAAGGAVAKATKATMEYGVEVNRNSQKLNISRQGYQEWGYVLKRSGSSIDTLKMGMKKLSTSIDDAKKGTKSATENFKRLGISVDDLKGKSQEQVFGLLIKRLQGVKDTTERSAIANKFFGRSAQELNGLLNRSGKEVDDLKKQANDLGLVMSDKAIKATADFRGALTVLQSSFEGLRNKMAVQFLPSLTEVTEGLSLLMQGKEAEGLKKIEKGIGEFTEKLNKLTPKLLELGGTILKSLGKGLINNLPTLLNAGASIITGLLRGIVKAVPIIISKLPSIATKIGKTLVDSIYKLLDGLGRTAPNKFRPLFQSLKEIIQDLLPAVKKGFELLLKAISTTAKVVGNIVSVFSASNAAGKALRTTVIGLTASFVAYTLITKAATAASILHRLASIAETIALVAMIAMTDGATAAFTALTAAMNINPFVLLATAIIGVVAALGYLISTSTENQSQTQKDIELLRQKRQAIDEERAAWEKQREETARQVESENSYYDRIQGFADRLKTLVDAKGRVKKADEAQVQMILGQLNEALGTEYKLVDGQIQNYQKLQDEINNTIQAKRTEALLAAEEKDYRKALDEREDAEDRVREASKKRADAHKSVVSAEDKIKSSRKRMLEIDKLLMKSDEELKKSGLDRTKLEQERYQKSQIVEGLTQELKGLKAKEKEANKTLDSAKKKLQGYYNTIIKYETALTAQSSKEYDKAVKALSTKDKKMSKASSQIVSGIAKGTTSEKALKEIDKSVNTISKRLFDGVKKWWEIRSPSHKAEDKLGYQIGAGYGIGIVKGYEDIDPMNQINGNIMASSSKFNSAINASLDIKDNLFSAVKSGLENANVEMKVGEKDFARLVKKGVLA